MKHVLGASRSSVEGSCAAPTCSTSQTAVTAVLWAPGRTTARAEPPALVRLPQTPCLATCGHWTALGRGREARLKKVTGPMAVE
ncbi:uncharacterized protein VTP21DRAFT_8976 [Calcarisporiella thermophila]|uniref:uncharacterized protein n=1 Tax=Calcarisporiella thermophila TaxID=911321 RepID=UPI0037442C87